MSTHRSNKQYAGLTLIELVVVLAILIALAGIAVPRMLSTTDTAHQNTTRASAVEIRDATMQLWSDCKYSIADQPNQRIQLAFLMQQPIFVPGFEPNVGLGWNGPYMQTDGRNYTVDVASGFSMNYGNASHPSIRDTYLTQDFDGDGDLDSGSPFVIQEPTLHNLVVQSLSYSIGEPREVRIVSAGANGILDIPENLFASELQANPSLKGDDVYVTFILR